MDEAVREAIGRALGAAVVTARPVSGGDINQAYAATLANGREVFVKTNSRPPPGMFAAEARGLGWLDEARAVRVPAVIATDERFLILELFRGAHAAPSFDEDLGRSLAALHRAAPPAFGLDHDNFIGRLPQSNRSHARWSAFFCEERLLPQLRRAIDAGLLPPTVRRGVERVIARLDDLAGPEEPPARLHGDLWGGNVMRDDHGAPCLIDPAVHGGHREVDLAMMRLFGGFGARVFDAYDEAFPLSPGHLERVPLYQLYPLLVHVNLFGGSYVGAVAAAVADLR